MTTYYSKLERGQAAWFLRENKVVTLPIGSVKITFVANDDGTPSHEHVTYGFRIKDASGTRFVEWEEHPESECFATKEELLASL